MPAVRFSAWPEALLGSRWRITFAVHPATIGRWAARYRQRGAGRAPGPEHDARGRPRRLQVEHLELLRQTVLTPPRKLGYAFTAWTLSRLGEFLKRRTGVTVQPH